MLFGAFLPYNATVINKRLLNFVYKGIVPVQVMVLSKNRVKMNEKTCKNVISMNQSISYTSDYACYIDSWI